MVENNGRNIAAGFFFEDSSSSMLLLEFIMTDPELKPRVSAVAVDMIVKKVNDYAAAKNKDIVYTLMGGTSVKGILERNGYKVGERNMTSMYMQKSPAVYSQFLEEEDGI